MKIHLCIIALGVGAACADPHSPAGSVVRIEPRQISSSLSISDSSTPGVIVVTLGVRGDRALGKIGSFTARISYDSTALTFLGETALADGGLRAVNPTSGLIRVAGAAASGMDGSTLIALRFSVTDRAALARARVDIEELHEVNRADLRSQLMRPTPPEKAP